MNNIDWPRVYRKSKNLSEFLDKVVGPDLKRYTRPQPWRAGGVNLATTRGKQHREQILSEIYPQVLVFADQRVDPRIECIYLLGEKKYWVGRKFVQAIAKAPKWWKVWRKFNGNVPASQFAYSKRRDAAHKAAQDP